jgi:hypothetical protein
VPAVLAAATGSDWNSGGSLLTFYFPAGLFIIIATSLYLEFSRPHASPDRKRLAAVGTITVTQAATARQGENAAPPPDSPAGGTVSRQQRSAAADPDHETPGAGT